MGRGVWRDSSHWRQHGAPIFTPEVMDQAEAQASGGTVAAAEMLLPLFAPYWGGLDPALVAALDLLLMGDLAGVRRLEGGQSRAYALQWAGAQAPLEPTRCVLTFPEQPGIRYDFAVPAHRLLRWLATSQRPEAAGDLPDDFWQWLILGEQGPT